MIYHTALFTEHWSPVEYRRPLFSKLCGVRYPTIRIEVTLRTYKKPEFLQWIVNDIMPYLHSDGGSSVIVEITP